MTIRRLLLRFGVVYGLLLIAGGLLLGYFEVKGSTGINTGILVGCLMWVCGDFYKKNGRYFSSAEKLKVVLGLLAVDVLIQLLLGSMALLGSSLNFGALLLGVAIVAVMHGIFIYVLVAIMEKPITKQRATDG